MYNSENHFYGGCGIVGAQIPLGAGLGLAHQYRKVWHCSSQLNQGMIMPSAGIFIVPDTGVERKFQVDC